MKKGMIYVFMQFTSGKTYDLRLFSSKKAVYEYALEVKNLPDEISKSKFYKKITYNPFSINNNKGITWGETDYNSDEYGSMDFLDYSVYPKRLG